MTAETTLPDSRGTSHWYHRRPIQKSKSEEEGEELEMQGMENERCQSEHSGEQLIQIGMESKI